MKKKKWWIVGIIFIILSLGIGGKVYMDKQEIKNAEQELALYIVQNYEEVKTIEFKKFKYNSQTGIWHVSTKINANNQITFSLESLKNISENNIGVRFNPSSFDLLKHKDTSKTLEEITIK